MWNSNYISFYLRIRLFRSKSVPWEESVSKVWLKPIEETWKVLFTKSKEKIVFKQSYFNYLSGSSPEKFA